MNFPFLISLTVILCSIYSWAIPINHGIYARVDGDAINIRSADNQGSIHPFASNVVVRSETFVSRDEAFTHTLERRSKVGNFFKKVGGWFKHNWPTVLGVATKFIP